MFPAPFKPYSLPSGQVLLLPKVLRSVMGHVEAFQHLTKQPLSRVGAESPPPPSCFLLLVLRHLAVSDVLHLHHVVPLLNER